MIHRFAIEMKHLPFTLELVDSEVLGNLVIMDHVPDGEHSIERYIEKY